MGTWLKSTHNSATLSFWLGSWKVGGILYEGRLYKAFCNLPGSKMAVTHHMTEDDAQKAVEKEVEYWIMRAGLKHELMNNQI